MRYNGVMLFEFFAWWYGRGWLEAWRTARRWVVRVQMEFSAPVLLRTLFSPWKQIVTLPGHSPGDKLRAMLDNLVSRCIGFIVRFLALISALVMMILAGLAGLVVAVAWPVVPLAAVYLLFRSLAG